MGEAVGAGVWPCGVGVRTSHAGAAIELSVQSETFNWLGRLPCPSRPGTRRPVNRERLGRAWGAKFFLY